MSILDTIKTARSMGASDDQIVSEILKQNPDKAATLQKAKSMGAQPSDILNEITKQNTPIPTTDPVIPKTGANPFGKATPKVLTDYKSAVSADFTSAAKSIMQDPTQGKGGMATVPQAISSGLDIASKVTGAVLSPITRAISPILQPILQKMGDNVNKDPWVNTLLNHVNDMIDKHPQAAQDLGNLFQTTMNVAGLVGSGEAVPKVASVTGDLASGVVSKASGVVSKVKTIPENILASPIPKQVKTALGETSVPTFDKYATIAKDASVSYKNPTPLEYSGTRAQLALDTIQRKLSNAGSTKSSVLESGTVGNKPVGNIVTKFRQQLNTYISNKTTIAGDTKLIRDINEVATKIGNNPSALTTDRFIDFVQSRIYTGKRDLTVPVTDQTTSALQRMTGQLNESLKSQLPANYRTLNSQYSDLVQIRNELNAKLGVEGEKGGALMKRVFSPSDANTKKLFADVQKVTGVDLVTEATIARYVMETMGDTRQANMLQQLGLPKLSAPSILQWAKNYIARGVNTPKATLNRARKLTVPSQIREAQ